MKGFSSLTKVRRSITISFAKKLKTSFVKSTSVLLKKESTIMRENWQHAKDLLAEVDEQELKKREFLSLQDRRYLLGVLRKIRLRGECVDWDENGIWMDLTVKDIQAEFARRSGE